MTAIMGYGPPRRQKSVVVSDHFTRADSATTLGSTEDGKLWVPMTCVPLGNLVADPSYMYLPGAAGCYASVPDSVALSITGDIDIRVRVALADWTPGAINVLLAKWTTTGSQQSYALDVDTAGKLLLAWSTTGANTVSATSTVAPTVSDGAVLSVRATLQVNDGAGNRVVKFYTSPDADLTTATWTQLGTTVTTVGTTSIFNATSGLEIGSHTAGASLPATGKFYRAQVRSSIGGTVVYDADFTKQTAGARTFTEDSAQAATVTTHGGELGITSNQAYSPAAGFLTAAVLESGVSDCDISARLGAAQDGWAIVFRWLDPLNYGIWQRNAGVMLFGIRAGGAFFGYTQDGGSDTSSPAVGDVDTVSLHGGRINIFRNGKWIAGAADYSVNLRSTKHGILSYNSTAPRIDDFAIAA